MSGRQKGSPATLLVSSVVMMLWRPLETSQVENLSPIRVKIATPCVLCPVRTCAAPPCEHNTIALVLSRSLHPHIHSAHQLNKKHRL